VAPIISCVIPVFNDKVNLPRAVESVLCQRPDVQVVLVDDCSTDGSRELALEMARGDRRILAFPLPGNVGQGYARNIGVTAADAPYVTFLDQDDEHSPGWYDHAVDVLESNPQFAAVRGDVELMDVPAELTIPRDDLRRQAIVNSAIWNMVIRRVVYQALGGCPSSPAFRTRQGAEDVTLVVALKQHFSVAKSTRVASRHYVRPGGATAYFLKRSRVTGVGMEFLEVTEEERSGALEGALVAYQARAEANIGLLRGLLRARKGGLRKMMANFSARVLRKISGN
jgi:glycosyltransferase involved in cell wall biosynthesis